MYTRIAFLACICAAAGCAADTGWTAQPFTPAHSFTSGVEGPACDRDGNLYAVSYQRESTIGKVTPQGQASLFVEMPDAGRANGLRLDSHGNLIVADYFRHRVYLLDTKTGKFLENLTRDWKGPEFYQPNDVAIAADDTIYFSDPDWKDRGGAIYMIAAPPHRRTVLLEKGLTTPNGITVSPDEKHVYVGQSEAHNILVYDRNPDGTLRNKRVLARLPEGGVPDGIRCDVKGNLWVAIFGLGRILLVHPDGKLDDRYIQLHGKSPTNLTFCGKGGGGRTLYITETEQGRIEKFTAPDPGIR
ncbi:MAG TPA: SMP-30/gluconolactonase/LRE family protein [Bryobacteraceae bacterium]|nr:SMP-30/gluconolactonase/LRE family protein [Bryobacteraceae bacterium]